jgi:FAD-dependent urate hydroxylase
MVLPVREASAVAGAPSMDVDRRRLQEELIDLLGAGRYRFASSVTGVERDGDAVGLTLADGGRASGDLALGADGIHSIVRDRVLGQQARLKRSRYAVIQGLAALDERHLPRGRHKQVWGRRVRCGVGWVSDERVRWFLGGRGIGLADEPPPTKEELLARVHGMPEIVSAVVEATAEADIGRTDVRHGYPPRTWHDDRVVLLGDAAHTLSPFAGMGACSAIEDAACLVELLDRSPSVPAALAAFQARREATARRIERTGRRNELMMMPPNVLAYRLRNAFLARTPDRRLLEIAAGMAGGEG